MDKRTEFFSRRMPRFLAAFFFLLILSGCVKPSHEHTFFYPTCELPGICSGCGLENAPPLGHDYSEATCTDGEICRRCLKEGKPALGHSFSEEKDSVCAYCGVEKRTIEVYNAMTAMKSSYPEGMSWTNDNYSDWKGGHFTGGYGCAGFAFILSDAAFGSTPCKMGYDINEIRVGDILRINDNTHSVVVLAIDGDSITVAEGNYNGIIHWGRVLDRKTVKFDYYITRY